MHRTQGRLRTLRTGTDLVQVSRIAAREATIKALNLSEAGLDWRQIEALRDASGQPDSKD
jgi:phosphopantetheinyl transferase (holo-ACP synthase)